MAERDLAGFSANGGSDAGSKIAARQKHIITGGMDFPPNLLLTGEKNWRFLGPHGVTPEDS